MRYTKGVLRFSVWIREPPAQQSGVQNWRSSAKLHLGLRRRSRAADLNHIGNSVRECLFHPSIMHRVSFRAKPSSREARVAVLMSILDQTSSERPFSPWMPHCCRWTLLVLICTQPTNELETPFHSRIKWDGIFLWKAANAQGWRLHFIIALPLVVQLYFGKVFTGRMKHFDIHDELIVEFWKSWEVMRGWGMTFIIQEFKASRQW